jgi:hypothetical protein
MPQVLDKTGIINLAMALIGQKPVTATEILANSTVEAVKINAIWDTAFYTSLRDHNWRFARQRVELAADSVAPLETVPPGFTYVWKYPTDAVKVRKVFTDNTKANPDAVEFFEFQGIAKAGIFIATNDVNGDGDCFADITSINTGTAFAQMLFWDPQFVMSLSAQLAYLASPSLTGNENTTNRMAALYNTSINRAQLNDAREERLLSTKKNTSEFIGARG